MPDLNTNNDKSFFQRRMDLLGVTEENNTIRVINPEIEKPANNVSDTQIFSEDKDGNIKILYWTLDRELITYYKMGEGKMSQINAKPQYYYTLRLREPQGDRKYLMPKSKWLIREGNNSTFGWYAPAICEAYEQKQQIETLVLTEGVFKAAMANLMGIPTVGLSSITHYRGRDEKLYHDLQRLIIECKVKNVIILWDGDCMNISENALAKRENLTDRPAGFYMAAKNIRKLIREIEYPDNHEQPAVYFYHVLSDIYQTEKPKGLDDLLIVAKEKGDAATVVKQALQPFQASTFFKNIDITDTTIGLREYFGLHDRTVFYKRHRDIIKANEFKFFGDLVKWDEEKEEVKLISPTWAGELYWVGDEYFMEIDLPGVGGTTRKELVSRSATTLTKRFGNKFWRHLTPFDQFCNLPEHLDYKKVIEVKGKKFYNQYFPFQHIPAEGDWQHIKEFMQHIFGTEDVEHALTGEKIPRWQLGMDYVQLLYLNPIQQLPVLILYSPENKTGKSTFGLLMAKIFGDNVVPIGNSDLQSDFNSTYSSKLIAICDETLLEKKKESEKIKAISTSPRILVNPKGQKQYMIDFFCKFIFTSNNARMIYVNRHDTRFWIHLVPQFQKEIPNMLEIMESEIPAFLHHLQNRELTAKQEGRMHFHDSLLSTEALEATVRINEPGDATELRERIQEIFVQDHTIQQIEMPLKNIREEFFGATTKTGWIKELLRDYLEVQQVLNSRGQAKVKRGFYPKFSRNGNNELVKEEIAYLGRPYLFLREKFIEEESLEDYKEIEDEERKKLAGELNGSTVAAKKLTTPVGDDLPF